MSPSASLADAVSANGVRSGMDSVPGTVSVGVLLPVSVTAPPRVVWPPLATSPTRPVHPPVQLTSCSSLTLMPVSVPPKVSVKAVSPSALGVTVPPAGQPAVASIAALTPAAVKLLPRTIGAESAPL